MNPGNSAAEKELSQLYQAQNALNSANDLFDSGDYTKALEYIYKVVLVFSPECYKVCLFTLSYMNKVPIVLFFVKAFSVSFLSLYFRLNFLK